MAPQSTNDRRNVSRAPGHGFPLAVPLPHPSLNLTRGHGTLESQETAHLHRHVRPKGIDRHDHPPVDGKTHRTWRPLEQRESVRAQCRQLPGRVDPHFHQNGDGLVQRAAHGATRWTEGTFQVVLKHAPDVPDSISGKRKSGSLLQPLKTDEAVDADLREPPPRSWGPSARSEQTETITSSSAMPPWPTTRSVSRTKAARCGARRGRQSLGRPVGGHSMASGNRPPDSVPERPIRINARAFTAKVGDPRLRPDGRTHSPRCCRGRRSGRRGIRRQSRDRSGAP